jgi:hypothetical protein
VNAELANLGRQIGKPVPNSLTLKAHEMLVAVPTGLEPVTFGLGNLRYECHRDPPRCPERNKCLQFYVCEANCLSGSFL